MKTADHAGQAAAERLAWAQFQVAALIHDGAHTVRTWQARQSAFSAWAALFLHDERTAA